MDIFVTGFLLSLSLCLDIGIVNVAIIDSAIKRGARAGILVGLGSCFGDLLYAALSAAGVAWLLRYGWVQWAIWLGGTTMLLWLAARMTREAWLDASRPETAPPPLDTPPPSDWLLLRRGAMLALASPSSLLWFAAVGAGLIAEATAGQAARVPLFLTGFFVGGFVWSVSIALLAARGGSLLGNRLRRWCHIASALLFLYFAVKVGWNGYVTLWRS
ncbi:LysE family translocator [Chitinimonas lacunae]|uniref:LysE family translocator n=1 Tax=Chitinimonas lacunae TaxID=1963018 RepID=A0ABV8MS35_9NEIS